MIPRVGSIRIQLLLLILVIGVPVAGLAVFSSIERQADDEAAARADVARLSHAYADRVETAVLGTAQFIRPIANFLGAVESLTVLDEVSCRAAFAPFAEGSNLDLMGAILPDGTLLCAHEELPPGASLGDRPYAQEALAASGAVVGPVDVSPLTGALVVPVLYPIHNGAGDVTGAMVAMMRLDTFLPADLLERHPDGAFVIVTDGEGNVIARHPDTARGRVGQPLTGPNFDLAVAEGRDSFAATSADGVPSFVGLAPVEALGDEARIVLGLPQEDAVGDAISDLWRDSTALLFFTAMAFGIALVGSQWLVVGPVRRMQRAAEGIASGDLATPDFKHPPGELGDLSRSFESMAQAVARRRAENEELNATLERRVHERTEALEAANRELEAFSYSVSHDLRSPLRAIDGFAELVETDLGDDMPESAKRYMSRVRAGTQRMGMLIDDLLQFSRVGRQDLTRRPFDLTTVVRETVEDLQPPEGVEIEWQIGDLGEVVADRAMVRRITDNLIGNAVKFSSKVERPKIEVGRLEQDGETVFYVRDNGVGFDMAYADKLFGMFQRLHLPEEFEGTGVGLAIVQRVVSKHGGRVWVDAAVDRGATFYFTLGDGEATSNDQ